MSTGLKLTTFSSRNVSTDCRCEQGFFSHEAVANDAGQFICDACTALGRDVAECRGFDELDLKGLGFVFKIGFPEN